MLSSKLQLTLRDRKVLAALCCLIVLVACVSSISTYLLVVKGQSSSLTMQTHSGGPQPGAPSYTIFVEDGVYYAKDAYGAIAFSSTNAATTINNALNGLTSGRTWQEKVVIKGQITLPSSILVSGYTILDIQGNLTLANGVNDYLIKNTHTGGARQYFITINGGTFNGNSAGQTSGGIIFMDDVQQVTIQNCNFGYVYNGRAIDLYLCEDGVIFNNMIGGSGIYGEELASVTVLRNEINGGHVWDAIYFTASTHTVNAEICYNRIYWGNYGVYIAGGINGRITYNTIEGCEKDGIYITSGSVKNTISGNHIWNNGQLTNDTYSGIVVGYGAVCVNNTISENVIFDDQTPKTQKYGIKEGDDTSFNIITGNTVTDSGASANILPRVGSQSFWENNNGFVTKASGYTACGDGVTAPHGLAGTPTSVTITSAEKYYQCTASTFTSTTFKVEWTYWTGTEMAGAPGSHAFSWSAIYQP